MAKASRRSVSERSYSSVINKENNVNNKEEFNLVRSNIQRIKVCFILGLPRVWHFCRASDGRKLERLQERGLRAVYKDKHASYTQVLERAKLPTLANRRLQDICILMYKVKHRLCPNSICYLWEALSALCRTQIMGQTVYGRQISQDTAGFYKLYSQKGYNSHNGHRL